MTIHPLLGGSYPELTAQVTDSNESLHDVSLCVEEATEPDWESQLEKESSEAVERNPKHLAPFLVVSYSEGEMVVNLEPSQSHRS